MKYTKDIQEKIKKALQDMPPYPYIGIRSQEEPFLMGEPIDHVSSVWIDGDETDDTMIGLSATDPDFIHLYDGKHYQYGYYFGDHVAIIGSYEASPREDVGEIVMVEPVVLDVIA